MGVDPAKARIARSAATGILATANQNVSGAGELGGPCFVALTREEVHHVLEARCEVELRGVPEVILCGIGVGEAVANVAGAKLLVDGLDASARKAPRCHAVTQ